MSTHLRSTTWAHVVSPSQLTRARYCDCGNVWLTPPPPPGLQALSWGKELHAYAESLVTSKPTTDADPEIALHTRRAIACLGTPARAEVEVEYKVRAGLRLHGRVDAMDDTRVVDWKFHQKEGYRAWPAPWLQLTVYALATGLEPWVCHIWPGGYRWDRVITRPGAVITMAERFVAAVERETECDGCRDRAQVPVQQVRYDELQDADNVNLLPKPHWRNYGTK